MQGSRHPVARNLSVDGARDALRPSNAGAGDTKQNYVSKMVMETAARAVEFTELTAGNGASEIVKQRSVRQRHTDVPTQEKKTEDPTLETLLSWTAAKSLGEVAGRCERLRADVYGDPDTLTPTEEQAAVLPVVHERVVKAEYELAGEQPPSSVAASMDVERPLLRLVRGLWGSGKSKPIALLKRYFQEVWQWTRGKQRAQVAPMNAMADNIGGSTMHSFGRIPFKDRKGMLIKAGGESEAAGMLGSPGDWHELRFLLIDEVEAAGSALLGQLEESLRLHVPSTNAALDGVASSTARRQRASECFRGRQRVVFRGFLAIGPRRGCGYHVEPGPVEEVG